LILIADEIIIDGTTNVAAFHIQTSNTNFLSNIMHQIPIHFNAVIPNHRCCYSPVSSLPSYLAYHRRPKSDRMYLSASPYEEHVDIEDDDDEHADEEEISDEDLLASAGQWDEKVARYNVVHLTGRVGSINELKYLGDGKVVLSLSLASTRKYHWLEKQASSVSDTGEDTDWYTLEVWGQKAEFISKFIDKGSRVSVVGQLQIDSWNDKETLEPRIRPKIIVREFEPLESKAEAELRRKTKGTYTNSDTNMNSNSNNNSRGGSNTERQRGRSFYTTDDDEDDESDDNNFSDNKPGSRSAGTGGYFNQ
jgi:single-strand DNA-binding protein